MNKRVVVTGMGVISPVGNNTNDFWNSIVSGKNGIDRVTKFDITDFKATLAGEVRDFDTTLYMDKGEARKLDRYSQYALAAVYQAVEESKIIDKIAPERLGVYLARA